MSQALKQRVRRPSLLSKLAEPTDLIPFFKNVRISQPCWCEETRSQCDITRSMIFDGVLVFRECTWDGQDSLVWDTLSVCQLHWRITWKRTICRYTPSLHTQIVIILCDSSFWLTKLVVLGQIKVQPVRGCIYWCRNRRQMGISRHDWFEVPASSGEEHTERDQ